MNWSKLISKNKIKDENIQEFSISNKIRKISNIDNNLKDKDIIQSLENVNEYFIPADYSNIEYKKYQIIIERLESVEINNSSYVNSSLLEEYVFYSHNIYTKEELNKKVIETLRNTGNTTLYFKDNFLKYNKDFFQLPEKITCTSKIVNSIFSCED